MALGGFARTTRNATTHVTFVRCQPWINPKPRVRTPLPSRLLSLGRGCRFTDGITYNSLAVVEHAIYVGLDGCQQLVFANAAAGGADIRERGTNPMLRGA